MTSDGPVPGAAGDSVNADVQQGLAQRSRPAVVRARDRDAQGRDARCGSGSLPAMVENGDGKEAPKKGMGGLHAVLRS